MSPRNRPRTGRQGEKSRRDGSFYAGTAAAAVGASEAVLEACPEKLRRGWPYYTRRWQNLRAKVLRERPICEHCHVLPSEHVDHIEPIAEGGTVWDRANLQALCENDHNRKTRIDQGRVGSKPAVRRSRLVGGCDVNGWPLDRRHWWHGAR